MVKKFLKAVLTGIFLVLIPACNKSDQKKVVSRGKPKISLKQKFSKKEESQISQNRPEDLELLALECTKEFKYKEAADVYAHLQSIVQEPELKANANFNQGKSLFLSGDYEKSALVLNKFAADFPENKNCSEARYLSLVSKYNCAKKVNLGLDQRAIEDVSKLAQSLAKDEALISKRVEIASIAQDCKERLCSKEIEKFELYLRISDFVSAKNRLCKIKEEYADLSNDFAPRMLYLESKLAKASGDQDSAKELVMKLVDQHADSRFAKMARSSFDGFFSRLA